MNSEKPIERHFAEAQVPRLSPDMSVTFSLLPEIEQDPDEDLRSLQENDGCDMGWNHKNMGWDGMGSKMEWFAFWMTWEESWHKTLQK